MKRILVAQNAPRAAHAFLFHAKVVAARLGEDPLFQPPPPSLAVFEADVAALEDASVAAATRGVGLAAARNARATRVMAGLAVLRSYVQTVADAYPPLEAAAVIERAGMSVKDARGPSKPDFVVKEGPVSGSVHLYARAATTRASYHWQYSPDGEPWLSAPETMRADAVLEGLAAGTSYGFRYRVVTREGISGWSEPFLFLPR
jgi:hypothetical protein